MDMKNWRKLIHETKNVLQEEKEPTLKQVGAKNFYSVSWGDITLYFSYQTLIAVSSSRRGTMIAENEWGNTTGKHINIVKKQHEGDYEQVPYEEVVLFFHNVL